MRDLACATDVIAPPRPEYFCRAIHFAASVATENQTAVRADR
jgi:hypothetical protein